MGIACETKNESLGKPIENLSELKIESHLKSLKNELFALLVVFLEQGKDFEEAKRLFYATIKSKSDTALQSIKISDITNHSRIILAIICLLNFESLFNMEIFLQDYSKTANFTKVVINCCYFANSKQWKLLKWFSSKPKSNFFEAKCTILEKFLKRQLTSFTENNLLDPEKLQFIYHCAFNLGNIDLQTQISHMVPGISKNIHSYNTFEDVEADGRIYDRSRDPPGQRCFYIPPGDPHKQTYRLSTFIKFPQFTPVNPRDLAAAGFYYTGYKDRVKCFSCGLCAEEWAFGDDVHDPRWHKPDCKMMKREDCGNIPIGASFARFSVTNLRHPPSSQSNLETAIVNNAVSIAGEVRPNNQQSVTVTPAGVLLMHGANSAEGAPRQTAMFPTNVNRHPQNIQLATIPSVHHEQLIRSLDLNKESDRLASFLENSSDNWVVPPVDLARFGFFYLGNMDRVQCFSCGGVLRNWKVGDNVEAEHMRHFPHCRMVLQTENRNIPISVRAIAAVPPPPPPPQPERPVQLPPSNSEESMRREREERYPCIYPVSPHMRDVEARVESFDYRWPFAHVRASPRDIAEAGFFFLGERDRVKCWYCNGGLQNWDPDDIPWREHAKWFPTCEFLLRMKGPEFAHQMILAFPNLRRPILRSPYDVAPIASLGMAPRRESRDISPPPPLIDPQKERIKMEQELHTALESAIAQRAVEMGFDIPAIQNVIRRQLANGGMMYTSVSPLIDDLTQYVPNSDDEDNSEPKAISPSGNSPQNKPEDETVTASQSVTMQVEPSATENVTPSMEERIRELQEERNCKICLDKAADVVFVPCGHLCCCVGCAGALRKCPICRVKIQKAIRTYMS